MSVRWNMETLPPGLKARIEGDVKAAKKKREERRSASRPRGKRVPSRNLEHTEQVTFIERVKNLAQLYPRYAPAADRTFAIPNGGGRSKGEAGRLKAEGVKAGVSDLFVAWPAGDRHGLWIEMKSMTGYPSREQKTWINESMDLGYHAAVCRGAGAAVTVWREYVDSGL